MCTLVSALVSHVIPFPRDVWFCSSLAELLVSRGTTFLDLGVGNIIGTRVGWSAQRVNDLTLMQHASMQAISQATPSDNDNGWSCDVVRRFSAFMAQRAHLGEVGAAQDALEHSGESVEALAQKHDQYMAILQDRALKREDEKPSAQIN